MVNGAEGGVDVGVEIVRRLTGGDELKLVRLCPRGTISPIEIVRRSERSPSQMVI